MRASVSVIKEYIKIHSSDCKIFGIYVASNEHVYRNVAYDKFQYLFKLTVQ